AGREVGQQPPVAAGAAGFAARVAQAPLDAPEQLLIHDRRPDGVVQFAVVAALADVGEVGGDLPDAGARPVPSPRCRDAVGGERRLDHGDGFAGVDAAEDVADIGGVLQVLPLLEQLAGVAVVDALVPVGGGGVRPARLCGLAEVAAHPVGGFPGGVGVVDAFVCEGAPVAPYPDVVEAFVGVDVDEDGVATAQPQEAEPRLGFAVAAA